MPNKRNLAIITAILALSACASPTVDTTAPTFDETKYTADLDTCRGGSALNAAMHGLGGAVIGSVIGAAEGVYHGAIAGDAPEGAFIGAIAGSVVGVFVGAYKPFQEQEQSVRQCLNGKGYVLRS
jgi:presenilin-like A22 family membrane protease